MGILLLAAVGRAVVELGIEPVRQEMLDGLRQELEAEVDERRRTIDAWLEERLDDASAMAGFPSVLAVAAGAEGSDALMTALGAFVRSHGYRRILVVRDGRVVVRATAPGASASPPEPSMVARALAGGRAVDLVRRADGTLRLVAAAAVVHAGLPRAVVVTESDPAEQLFRFVGSHPLAGLLAEALLVRRDGEELVYLSPLAHRAAPPGTLRLPPRTELPATAALAGGSSGREGVDYRGAPVLAATRRIERAPWAVLVKVDRAAAMAPIADRAGALALAWTGVWLVVVALVAGALWALTRIKDAELARSQARLALVLDQAHDVLLFVGLDGRVREVNRRAESFYGRPAAALVGLHVGELRPERLRAGAGADVERVVTAGSHLFETVQLRAGGVEVPVEVSARLVTVDGERVCAAVVRDVTERHRAQAELEATVATLRASEERVRAFFDAGLVGTCLAADLGGGIAEVNDEYLRILGATREDALVGGLRWTEFTPPEYLHLDRAAIEEARARGACTPYEKEVLRRDGTRVWVSIAFALTGARREQAVAVMSDISARKRAEASLRESQARLERAMAIGRMGAWDLDVAAVRPCLSREASALLQLDPEVEHDLDGVLDRFAPESGARALGALRRCIENGTGSDADHALRPVDGAARHVRLVIEADRGAWGAVTRVRGVVQDVTERRAAEDMLRKLSRAVEQSPAAILITDPSGRIEYVNPRFEEVSGWRASEVAGRPASDLSATSAEVEEMWAAAAAGRVWQGEVQARTRQGGTSPQRVTIGPVRDAEGEVTHLVAVQEDLTARKAAEEALARTRAALLQAQKMEAVGRLAGGVAHDFNNLLTVIDGYARLVLDSLPPDDDRARKLAQVVRASDRAADLTKQLLAFSRKLPASPRVVDVARLVAEMAPMLRRLLGETIALRLAARPRSGEVLVDSSQLEQVIMNLAVNARDAMPEGGDLAIEVAPEERHPAAPPGAPGAGWLRLDVTDTGVGMDEATRAHLFEPFFTTKAPGKGTGLGLATVHGIVEQAGGFLTVESAPGAGARFSVHLPRHQGAAPPAPAEVAPAAAVGGRETILLVEDEQRVRELAQEALEERGFRVLAAADGARALELLSGPQRIDLLLTDVVMPGLGGRALAERARRGRPELRVLFMSGYAEEPEGLSPLLAKPASPVALARAVREVLDRPAAA